MAEDLLVPNPDGCQAFEPNPFKKENCKNCRRKWEEHKGVIALHYVQEFMEARRKTAEEKEKARLSQLDKERAKAAAKKKALQAVDDEWLFEGREDGGDESDEDVGFKMLSAADMKPKAQTQPKQQQLVVKNLIDFGECDAADHVPVEPPQKLAAGSLGDLDLAGSGHMAAPANAIPAFSPRVSGDEAQPLAPPAFPDARLQAELEDLEMRLAQANEEKKLELEIVHDELSAKEKMVAELKQERDLAHAKLKELGSVAGITGEPTASGGEDGGDLKKEVSSAAAELVSDLHALCAGTPALRGSCPGADEADAGRTGCRVRNMGELENELRKVRQVITGAVEAARAQEARTALARPAGAEDAAALPTNGLSAAICAAAGRTPGAGIANASEAQLTAQAIGEVSATAFREIRTSADTQIAWIKERLSQKAGALLKCAA